MVDRLEALYRSRVQEFRRVAAAIAGDRELGCDVVQEAFAKAVRSAGRFNGSGTLEAWVWRIVVNAARDARRAPNAGSDPSVVEQSLKSLLRFIEEDPRVLVTASAIRFYE